MRTSDLLRQASIVLAGREICYHGTSSLFTREILKQGLLPNPNKRVYDKPDDPDLDIPITTFGGVYLTTNFMTAYSAAGSASRKFGGNRLICIADVERKSVDLDEDDIIGYIYRAIGKSCQWNGGWSSASPRDVAYTWVELLNEDPEIDLHKQEFLKTLQQNIKIPDQQLASIKPITDDLFVLLLQRMVAYQYARDANFKYKITEYSNNEKLKILRDEKQPKSKFVSEIREKIIEFMHKVNYFANEKGNKFNDTFRLTEPLSFSGSNKIISIIEIINDQQASSLKEIYGKMPEQFLRDYKKTIGEPTSYILK